MKFLRRVLCGAISVLVLTGVSYTVLAEAADEGINKATITIEAEIDADTGKGTFEVTSDGEGYFVDSFQFTEGTGTFEAGETPRVKVVLKSEDGYRFVSGFPKSRVTIKGQGTCTEVKRQTGGLGLEITAKLKAVSGTAGRIDNAYWADSPLGKARWDEADNAGAYELKLYYKNSVIKRVDKTTATTYDFYSYMTKVGTYYFEVRTIPRNSEEAKVMDPGDWVTSEELYVDSKKTADSKGNSSQGSGTGSPSQSGPGSSPGSGSPAMGNPVGPTGTGLSGSQASGWRQTDKGWRYVEPSGASPSNAWKTIDNKWYFFDMAGNMTTGWLRWSGRQYFLTVNGDMVTGWLQNNRDWYYMGADGAMQTGWVAVNGYWYYLGSDGIMRYGWQQIDGRWYYFDTNSGAMASNTLIDSRYLGGDGAWISQ